MFSCNTVFFLCSNTNFYIFYEKRERGTRREYAIFFDTCQCKNTKLDFIYLSKGSPKYAMMYPALESQ